MPDYDWVCLCYEKESGKQLKGCTSAFCIAIIKRKHEKRILVVVGPEGGFAESEVEDAEAAGAISVGLGKRILRTETAAMVALTCIMYESGELYV